MIWQIAQELIDVMRHLALAFDEEIDLDSFWILRMDESQCAKGKPQESDVVGRQAKRA